MEFQGLTLDKFQEQSVVGIEKNHSVLVSAPTGAGKTLIADYIIDKYLKEGKRIIYTAPIKALSNQKFKDFKKQYDEYNIGLITGDLVINPSAPVLIMTTEVYRNMSIINDPVLNDVAYTIFDEIHFISDEERGYIWEESIIFSPEHVRFLFLSATIPNSEEFAGWVESIKGHPVDVVKHHVRPVPLERLFYDSELGITTLDKIQEQKELDKYPTEYGKKRRKRYMTARVPPPDFRDLVYELDLMEQLPVIYFVFSRAKTQEYAVKLAKKKGFLTNEERQKLAMIVSEEFNKLSPEINSLQSTKDMRQCLPKGIAFHNAGVLPDLKHIAERLFSAGLIKVLFATETFAVGINMPAKSVAFDSLRKFTGTGFRNLNSKEYFQISGRAGRRGIDKKGLSVSVIYRPTADIAQIKSFTTEDTLPLKSQFKITPNTVLNMVHHHTPEEIQEILQKNFLTFQKLKGREENKRVLGSIKARFTRLTKMLTKLGYIKDDGLTEIGIFASKIFSDELEVSQMFMGEFNIKLDEYVVLLTILALVYEPRRGAKFFETYESKKTSEILRAIHANPVMVRRNWHENLLKMTAIINPLYDRKKFMEVIENTNLVEGDLIRLLLRVLDKLEQIGKAAIDNKDVQNIVSNCKFLIKNCLEGIHVV